MVKQAELLTYYYFSIHRDIDIIGCRVIKSTYNLFSALVLGTVELKGYNGLYDAPYLVLLYPIFVGSTAH